MTSEHFLLVMTAPPEELAAMFSQSICIVKEHEAATLVNGRWPDLMWHPPAMRPGDWHQIVREDHNATDPKTGLSPRIEVLGWLVGLSMEQK